MNCTDFHVSEDGATAPSRSFTQEALRLAEAARCMTADSHGDNDQMAMMSAVCALERSNSVGGPVLREGLALAGMVRTYFKSDGYRPHLRKAIGSLATDILSGQGGGHGL